MPTSIIANNIKIKIGKIEQKRKEELVEKINKQIKDNIENLKKDTSTKDNNKNYSMFAIEKLKLINPQEKEVIDDLNKKRLEHIKYIQSLKDLNDSNKIHLNIDFLDLPSIEQDIINVNKSDVNVILSDEHCDYKWVKKDSYLLDEYIKDKLSNI